MQTNNYSISNTTLSIGSYSTGFCDTFDLSVSIDTNSAPRILTRVEQLVFTSFGKVSITGYYYITPWNTIEFFSEENVNDRKWLAHARTTLQTNTYFHQDSLPNAPDTTLPVTYVVIPGLGYTVPINYDPADTLEPSYKASYTYEGTITGRIIYPYLNDLGVTVDLAIAGAKIQLSRRKNFTSTAIIGHSLTNEDGTFSISYSFTSNKAHNNIGIKVLGQDFNNEEVQVIFEKSGKTAYSEYWQKDISHNAT